MFHLTDSRIDRVIACRHKLLCGGLATMALPWALPRGWGFGLFCGFMLFSLGIYGVAFRRWRTEPGLWMLAVLLTVLLAPILAYCEALHWRGVLTRPAARAIDWDQIRLSIDATMALVVFACTVNFVTAVAVENWRRTRILQLPYGEQTHSGPNNPMQWTRDEALRRG